MFKISSLKKITSIGSFAMLMTSALAVAPVNSSETEALKFEVNASGYLTPDSFSQKIVKGQTISLERTSLKQLQQLVMRLKS